MLNFLAIFVTAIIATMAFLPLAKLLGRRMAIWDHPDELGMHQNSTPRSGGVAIVFGIWVALEICWMLPQTSMRGRQLAAMGLGSLALFVIGLLDDLHEIKPHVKAIGLAAAGIAIMLVSRHIRLTGYERLDFMLGIFVLIAGANALNFLDGMDGLASGLTAVISLGFLAMGTLIGNAVLAGGGAGLAGAALGFCSSNCPPASIFMGDSGSLVLGGVLGWMFLILGSHGLPELAAAAILLSWRILDAGLAIIRRAILSRDIFTGDRRHVYDLMFRRYGSVWRVNGIMFLIQVWFVALALSTRCLSLVIPVTVTVASWLAIIFWMVRLGMFAPLEDEPKGKAALPEVESVGLDKGTNG